METSPVSLLKIKSEYKVFFLGYFIPPKPNTNYQKIKIKHYFIGRKWEKHKNQKVKDCRKVRRICEILRGLQKICNLAKVHKFGNPCQISLGIWQGLLLHLSVSLLLLSSGLSALNCNWIFHALT